MELHYQEYGEGETLMILHGLLGASGNWHTHAKKLAESYHVITVDLRNHGRSPHSDTMSYPEMAKDVLGLIEKKAHSRVHLMGHSMGGKVAMTLALMHPDVLSSLLVIDMAPVQYPPRVYDILEALQTANLDVSSRKEIESHLAKTILEPGVRQFLMKNLSRTSTGFEWKVPLNAIEQAMPELLSFPDFENVFKKPALFLGGKNSNYVLPEYHPVIHELFSKARMVMLKDTGHWVHAESPKVFLDAVQFFLKSLRGGQ